MHQPVKGLFFTEGIRMDWDQSYKWNFIPQLNISYVMKEVAWRGSIGKGVRDADFTERYNNYNKTLVTSGRIGNPALKAEKSVNLEIGADVFLNQPVQLHATFFKRNQTNMIDWVQTKFGNMPRQVNLIPTGSYALAQNIANVNTSGVEFDIKWRTQVIGEDIAEMEYGIDISESSCSRRYFLYLSIQLCQYYLEYQLSTEQFTWSIVDWYIV